MSNVFRLEDRLRRVDRAADARVRIYGHELNALLATAKAIGLSSLPVEAVEAVVHRMLNQEDQR